MTSRALRRAGLSLVGLAAWLLFAQALVSSIITSADVGAGLPLLNALMIGRSSHPLSEYLKYWHNVTLLGTLCCAGWWAIGPRVRVAMRPALFELAVGAATSGRPGAVRSWTCAILRIGFEPEPWKRAFANAPRSPTHGELIDRYLYPVPASYAHRD